MTDHEAASREASGTPPIPLGATVRWTTPAPGLDTWFTARIISGYDEEFDGYDGVVVDPGTFRLLHSDLSIRPGEIVLLCPDHIVVVDSEPITEDEECE